MRGHPKSERFFTAEEKEKLKATTQDVESRTIGEIVVMVVNHSDHYIEAEGPRQCSSREPFVVDLDRSLF